MLTKFNQCFIDVSLQFKFISIYEMLYDYELMVIMLLVYCIAEFTSQSLFAAFIETEDEVLLHLVFATVL